MTRNDVSEKNNWYIPKERYLELVHFCRQYPHWRDQALALTGAGVSHKLSAARGQSKSDPTAYYACMLAYYEERMDMVYDSVCGLTDDIVLINALMKNIVYGTSYDILSAHDVLPVSRSEFYNMRRQFFYILDGRRN